MKFRTFLIVAFLVMLPIRGAAQIDAIIDAVVDAVEPTPVYDTDLTLATQDLAQKIDRLNHVLFGGSEETSAAYRYMNMYSDLYDLTSALSTYVTRSYNNAMRLERMYSRLDSESSLHDYADLVDQAWYTYQSTVRNGSRIVDQFKKIFGDPHMTNQEVREAAKQAIVAMNEEMDEEEKMIQEEIAAMEIATGLVECAEAMTISSSSYVEIGKKTYGESINEGGSSIALGTFGSVIFTIVVLLCIIYVAIGAIQMIKQTNNAGLIFLRILAVIGFGIALLLVFQQYI